MISIAAFGFAGECCVACAVDAPSVAAGSGEACQAACCQPSGSTNVTQQLPEGPQLVQQPAPPSWFTPLIPWLTPLGGVVLVVAHLLNHRSGCPHGCCH